MTRKWDGIPGHTGDPLDRFYTPGPLARAVVQKLEDRWGWDSIRVDLLVEPSVGCGDFVDAFVDAGWHENTKIQAVDLDPKAPGLHHSAVNYSLVADFLDLDVVRNRRHVAVVGNPPFACAQEHLAFAVSIAGRVAFLLPADVCVRSERTGWPQMFERFGADCYPIQDRAFGDHLREAAIYVVDDRSPVSGVRVLSRERIRWT